MSLSPSNKPRKSVKKGEGLWLLSFSDMVLTLMCFFLLLLSTMKPNKEKFENVKDGLTHKNAAELKSENLRSLSKRINKVIQHKKLDKAATIEYDADGLHIEFKDGILFRSGSAQSMKEYEKLVRDVMKVISEIGPKYNIVIEGHTDNVPLKKTELFPSNWELSAARGFAIMRLFHELGVPENKISVVSYAHTKPKVPFENLVGEGLKKAQAANRRVVILIE